MLVSGAPVCVDPFQVSAANGGEESMVSETYHNRHLKPLSQNRKAIKVMAEDVEECVKI